MSGLGPKLALYFVVLAVWLVFVGAVLNQDRVVVVAPLALGAALGLIAVTTGILWLAIPVSLLWAWGLGWMVHDQRQRGR